MISSHSTVLYIVRTASWLVDYWQQLWLTLLFVVLDTKEDAPGETADVEEMVIDVDSDYDEDDGK